MKMHPDQVDIDIGTVVRLIADQFPDLADLPVEPVRSTGTVNAIFRLGDELCARLPHGPSWALDIERELRWLPWLAPRLSMSVPEPVGRGVPTEAYPFTWAIYRWLDGDPYENANVGDGGRAAEHLARFVTEMRSIDITDDVPHAGRRPLPIVDQGTRTAIESSSDEIDCDAAIVAWERALEAPLWDERPVWIHADLLPPNLLVRDGELAAVIDFGGVGAGDPATDLVAAWSVFDPDARRIFRRALDADDGAWERARGIALHQAAHIIPYYRDSNPSFVSMAVRTVERVIADP